MQRMGKVTNSVCSSRNSDRERHRNEKINTPPGCYYRQELPIA